MSVNIKKDSTYDEIINTVDDYCRKHHKNTSIRFALGFYYLFLTKADRESEDYYEDLHMVIDVFGLLSKNTKYKFVSSIYADTFLHIIKYIVIIQKITVDKFPIH